MKSAATSRSQLLCTLVLAIYWLAMLAGTHWPNFKLDQFPQNTDKVLHLSAYAGLAFLIALRLGLRRSSGRVERLAQNGVSMQDCLWIMAVIVAYSIFDELTQPYFGRTCEFLDALADWIGGIVGLGVFTVLRFFLRRMGQRSAAHDS